MINNENGKYQIGKYFINRRKFSIASAGLIFLAHMTMACLMFMKSGQSQVYSWFFYIFALLSLPYFNAILTKRFILYEAIYLFFAGILLNYTLLLLMPEEELFDIDWMIWAHVLYLLFIGLIAFMVGYISPIGRKIARALPIKNFIVPEDKIPNVARKMYLTGYFLFTVVYFLEKISIRGYQVFYVATQGAVKAAIMLDLYHYFSAPKGTNEYLKRKKYLYRGLFFMCIEVVMGMRTGMKEMFLMPIIMALVAYVKARKKIPIIFMLAGMLFFINVLTPFTGAYRSKSWFEGASFYESFSHGLDAVFEARKGKEATELETSGLTRLSDSTFMAILCEEKVREGVVITTFKNPFEYLSRFIPRFLWPNKPTIDYNRIGRELGLLHPGDYSTSIGITFLAGLIMGGGLFSVILGFLFIGILLKIYWSWLIERSGDNILAFVAYFSVMYVWIRDPDLMVGLHGTISFLIYTYVMAGFIKKRAKY